nr:MAG TPA: hypothetical protein [Caudoviricetes sp.]
MFNRGFWLNTHSSLKFSSFVCQPTRESILIGLLS